MAIPMTTDSTEQLLVDGVQELYYMENKLVDALEELSEQSENDELQEAFSEHREETQQHVERLEKVFEELDQEPEERQERIIDAMIEEHDEFASENEGEVLDRYNMAVGQKTEHYEIAAYGNLTSIAGKLGYDEAADLLEETLREEEDALEEVTKVSEQFDQQQVAGD